MRRWLIAYDVAERPARDAMAATLDKLGTRVQKSVFLVEQTDAVLEKMERELQKWLGPSDSLLIAPLCETCFRKAVFWGKVVPLLVGTWRPTTRK